MRTPSREIRRVLCALTFIWAALNAQAATYTLKSKIFAGTFDGFADRLTITAGDLDGDGDVDLIGGYAQGGLVYLRNPETHLPVSPPSITVLPGETVAFTVPGYAGARTWALAANCSSGTLDSASGLYTAGPRSGVIDLVEASDGAGLYGRACVNVISPADVGAAGKAIVLAGRRGPSDPLWPTTDYLAGRSYLTLRYRGFARENIRYLSPVAHRDVDGNGLDDDIAATSTLAATGASITNWAAGADRLFIHLVDHGGDNAGAAYFRLSENEVLTAAQLDAWLDALQDAHHTEVIVLIDCCYAGSLLDELGYSGSARRMVIAACGNAEPTYFVAGGLVSFSDAFLSGVLLGLDVAQSFSLARNAMATYQTAVMTDTAPGEPVSIGSTFVAGRDIPQIGRVVPEQTLSGGQAETTLWAEQVISVYPVQRVWALIVPPNHNPNPDDPVGDLPRLDLQVAGGVGRYEGRYAGFNAVGTYKVIFYAEDIWGSVSLPRQSYVTQSGYDERVVLVTGGSTNDVDWASLQAMGDVAYHTFRARWFTPEAIRFLSPLTQQDRDGDGTNDIDGVASPGELAAAITTWAAGADKLTVCLIGGGSNGSFRVDASNWVTASQIDTWVDQFQRSNAEACVIMDFASAGSALPTLTPPPGAPRITIAGTGPNQPSIHSNGGLVSFTQYLFGEVFSGHDIGTAFQLARDAIRRVSGRLRQDARMDDNGDGNSDGTDGQWARQRYVGAAFLTGADAPTIGSVTPDGTPAIGQPLLLWAAGVTDMDGISNVWCVVTPPDYAGAGDLPRTRLAWNQQAERFESVYGGIGLMGPYVLTFQAEDSNGELSSPVQTMLQTSDIYELDDRAEQAGFFAVGTSQERNLHASGDEDWVQFFAVTGRVYTVETTHVGTNVDTVLSVYRQLPNGSLTNVVPEVDLGGRGLGQGETALLDPAQAGVYYVRVSCGPQGGWASDAEYNLGIWTATGPEMLVVVTVDSLHPERCPPGTVVHEWDGSAWQPHALGSGNNTSFWTPAGGRWIWVPTPEGYLPEEDPAQPGQVQNPLSYAYGNPKWVDVNTWPWVVFRFMPVVQVTNALVRDAWTGERIAGASLSFQGRTAPFSGQSCDGHPAGASWRERWLTLGDGAFPTNVFLPTADWDLSVSAAGYQPWQSNAVITGAAAGDVRGLGVLRLLPTDTDSNGVADAWQQVHFPGGGFSPTNDTDRDGHDDGTEYGTGTDPTNATSVLQIEAVNEGGPGGFTLDWPTVPWRTYRVGASEDLLSNDWPLVFGPREATAGQNRMSWTDTNAVPPSGRFYRIGVVPP